MAEKSVPCPHCGRDAEVRRNPYPTVDVIIEMESGGVVLIERRNPPPGWALPGGFVDYGETFEQAALREALEETGLKVRLKYLLGVYSDPQRDPRQHNVSVVFVAEGAGELNAGSDAKDAGLFTEDDLPDLAFDHGKILADYFSGKSAGPG